MKEAWIILIGYSGKGLLLVLTQDLAKTIQVENWKSLQINYFVVVDVVFLFLFFNIKKQKYDRDTIQICDQTALSEETLDNRLTSDAYM